VGFPDRLPFQALGPWLLLLLLLLRVSPHSH
jgi:hypothetical protein